MAQRHSVEVIERQINWLPNRNVSRSRLGLLRRAIEEDWPKPDGADPADRDSSLARNFAMHYYAAYHGFEGGAGTEPLPKDVVIGAKFIPRLLALEGDVELIPEWGRRFGRLIREKHQSDAKAKPNLSFALVLYGDMFLRMLQQEAVARRRKAIGAAKQVHQKAFAQAYVAYLRMAETELQRGNPSVYEAFAKHREKLRHLMTSGPFLATAERLARFENEESRLLDFASFFQEHPQKPVLGFWEWDARLNPRRFGHSSNAPALQETRP